jgi:predicted GIY-YIG superfamily endonuclease
MSRNGDDLEQILQVLINRMGREFFYTDIRSSDKNRLMEHQRHEGIKYVSPRLLSNELYWWIDGYMKGMERED